MSVSSCPGSPSRGRWRSRCAAGGVGLLLGVAVAACAVQTSPRLAGDAQPTTAAPAPTTEVAAAQTTTAQTTTAAPTRSPTPTRTAAARPKPPPAEPYYHNCTAARAAGAAPIRRGEPGYRPALDADNDGIACE